MNRALLTLALAVSFTVALPSFAGNPRIHSSEGKKALEKHREEAGGPAEEAGLLEIPTDINSLDALRNYLKRFKEEEIIIKLGATWCGPCTQVHPELEKLAEKTAGTKKILTIDIDTNPGLAKTLSPSGKVPAIITMKNDGVSAPSSPRIGYRANNPSPIGDWLKAQ